MKLDTKTIGVLKSFSNINPSMLFKEGNIIETISPNKTVMAKAVVPTKFENKFAIYNLGRFLSSVSLFSDPDLSFNDSYVTISGGNGKKINYTFADERSIKIPPEGEIKLPTVDVRFSLTDDTFKEVVRALNILGLPEIAVHGDGESVYIRVVDSKNPSGDTYDVAVGRTDKQFNIIFKSENITKILPGDYEVSISARRISHFKGAEAEYWIAVEATSTFG